MNVLMGIGNELKGDDGIGNRIARQFSAPGWKSISCETVPENFTSVVRRESPELLVIVDATDMGLEPGEMRIIPEEKLNSDVEGTHGIPLRHLVSYLRDSAGKIIFIGIQPKSMEIGDSLSEETLDAGRVLTEKLQKSDFSGIKTL
jgi:hydrogenase 3 maturation protease